MPRKNNVLTLTICAWPKLTAGKLHRGKVKGIRLDKPSNCLHVTIENLDPTQSGRIHEVELPLPVRPGNRTCRFLLACGLNATTIGAKICLDEITDAVVGMRFRGLGTDNIAEFDFEPISNRPAPAGADSSAAELGGGDTRRRA